MFLRVDDAILEWTERQSHRFQRLVGLTNFALARVALVVAMVCIVGAALLSSAPVWPIVGAVGSFMSMYLVMHWGWYGTVEEYYLNGSATAHPFTLLWRARRGSRLGNILLTLGALGAMFFAQEPIALRMNCAFAMPLWLATSYLECAIPLPPGMSKLREFKDKLSAFLRPTPHAIPAASS